MRRKQPQSSSPNNSGGLSDDAAAATAGLGAGNTATYGGGGGGGGGGMNASSVSTFQATPAAGTGIGGSSSGRTYSNVAAQPGASYTGDSDGKSKDGKAKKGGFKDWKRRMGEIAIQRIGLYVPSNDANTGDIEAPLQSFTQMRDGLKDVQAQIRNYVLATEGLFGAAHNMTFLFAPVSGETAKQLKVSLCRVAVQDAMVRGLTEYLETPLKAVLDFCDGIDALAKRRSALLLDYDHHKRKHEAVAARREAGKGDVEDEAKVRSMKLKNSIDQLKECTTQVLSQIAAIAKVEPQLKESLYKGLAACQVFYCQASLAAFDGEFVQSIDMQEYIMSLQRATSTLEKSLPLPPLGEHVTYLQNALAAAMAEARGETGAGEVFGRPLSDFEEPPPVLLECMGFLDAQGLYVPGLFRVPGNTDKIRELKTQFDGGEHVEFDEETHGVHEVATLLKMFFRELPDPVVPTAYYRDMLDASVRPAPEFLDTAKRCIAEFPPVNATCLRLLFAFLFRVSLCSTDNKMNTENLGIVFAPNLLRAPNTTEISVMDLQACINLVRRMIETATEIFADLWQGYPAASSQG